MSGHGRVPLLVARREFVERVRDRGFLISTAITLVILVGVILMNAAVSRSARYDLGVVGADARAVADDVVRTAPAVGFTVRVHDLTDRSAAETALRDRAAAAVILRDQILVESQGPDPLIALIQTVWSRVRAARMLESGGVPAERVSQALDMPPLRVRALEPVDERSHERSALAFVGVVALYGQLFAYGYWVASGVVEEKASRVIEVLLSTICPSQLLRGKILGIGVLGLCQLMLIAAVGLVTARATGLLRFPSGAAAAVGAVLLWFVLGYFFYATLFAVAGAIVPRQEDLQASMTPLTVLVVASFFVGISAVRDPSTGLAAVASVMPFSAPLVMPSRMLLGQLGLWQGLLSAGVTLAATAAMIPVATTVYSRAVLRTGKVRLREVLGAGRG